MQSMMLVLLVAALMALSSSALANPTPVTPPTRSDPIPPTMPNDPSAKIAFVRGGGTIHVTVEGDVRRVTGTCVGLEGSHGIGMVDVKTKLTEPGHAGRRAYALWLYPEHGCKWTDYNATRIVSYYDGKGEPLKDNAGKPMIPKSFIFYPQYIPTPGAGDEKKQ